MNLLEASQPQLAVAVVDRCGGRTQFVPWETVAVAIWRAFPERASLRTGLLPDTYSIQTWVWDAKTKLGFLEGGSREGGWRLTERGSRWLDQNPEITDNVRAALLDEVDYTSMSARALLLTCLTDDRPKTRAWMVIEAFRRFPAVFGLAPDRMWPDAEVVARAMADASAAGWITGSGDSFTVTPQGAACRTELAATVHQTRETRQSRRRSIAAQYAERVQETAGYRAYLDTGDRDQVTEAEFYKLIQCPPNAGPALIEASIAELLSNLDQSGRVDLAQFVRRWAQRVVPELEGRGLIGGEKW